jgi:hypothetical protein
MVVCPSCHTREIIAPPGVLRLSIVGEDRGENPRRILCRSCPRS